MIALGCDHTGYELKQQVREHLESMGYECKDYGLSLIHICQRPMAVLQGNGFKMNRHNLPSFFRELNYSNMQL